MVIYYSIFVCLCFYGLIINFFKKSLSNFILVLFTLFLVVFIGFRYEVGGDYNSYIKFYYTLRLHDTYVNAILVSGGDTLYNLVNVFFAKMNLQISSVNLVCAGIFCFGLYYYAKNQKYPILVLIVGFPYLILVVGLGYTRQATAIGIFLISIEFLKNKKISIFFILIIFASLFHKTALVLLGFGFLTQKKNRIIIFISTVILGLILFFILLAKELTGLTSSYVVNQTFESRGAFARAGLNILASALFFYNYKKFRENYIEFIIYSLISIASFIIFPLIFFASTFFDRMGLFLIPIQLYVYSNLFNSIFNKKNIIKYFSICFLYFCILFVWLQYGAHSYLWSPYQSVLIPSTMDKYKDRNKEIFINYTNEYYPEFYNN